jgi:hypothetical protein
VGLKVSRDDYEGLNAQFNSSMHRVNELEDKLKHCKIMLDKKKSVQEDDDKSIVSDRSLDESTHSSLGLNTTGVTKDAAAIKDLNAAGANKSLQANIERWGDVEPKYPKMHFLGFSANPALWVRCIACLRCFMCASCVAECRSTSSMYVMTFDAPSMIVSISLLKAADAPQSPWAVTVHCNCPIPGIVNDV